MEHRNCYDECEVEPVRNVDVRLFTLPDRTEEYEQIGNPYDSQPEVDIPFRFCVLAACSDAHDVTGSSKNDERLIAPEYEPWPHAASDTRTAGALNNVERRCQKHVTTERKDHCRCVQWAKATKVEEAELFKIEKAREGELHRDDEADENADNTPEH